MSKQVNRPSNHQQRGLWLERAPAPGLWLEEASASQTQYETEAEHQNFVLRAISAGSQAVKELVEIVKNGDPVEAARESANHL